MALKQRPTPSKHSSQSGAGRSQLSQRKQLAEDADELMRSVDLDDDMEVAKLQAKVL